MNEGCLNKVGLGLACLLVTCLLLCFCSCGQVRYVPVETVKTEVEYRDRWQRDSIHVRDSIYVRERGDTVFIDRWHTFYKDRILRDTMYVNRTDTIREPYPVEKSLSKWESFKIEIGGWAFGVILSFVLFAIIWLVYKKRNK